MTEINTDKEINVDDTGGYENQPTENGLKADLPADFPGNRPGEVPTEAPTDRDAAGRFIPGHPGGPGRPQGSNLSLTSIIKAQLQEIPEEGNPSKKSYAELLMRKMLKKALVDEDQATQKLIWNYMDGLPKQNLEHSGNLGILNLSEIAENFDKALGL